MLMDNNAESLKIADFVVNFSTGNQKLSVVTVMNCFRHL